MSIMLRLWICLTVAASTDCVEEDSYFGPY